MSNSETIVRRAPLIRGEDFETGEHLVVEVGGGKEHDDFFDQLKEIKKAAGIEDDKLKVNTGEDERVANIKTNIVRGHQQIWPFIPNGKEIAIVGGGWTLESTFEELRELYWRGVEIVACNNAASWLLERNIKPSAYMMLDARPDNHRFVEKPIKNCKYFLASQCDPSVFDACEGRDVYIWHTATDGTEAEKKVLDDYYLGNWVSVPGSSTIGFRSVCMLRILGYEHMHLFGIDSCYSHDGKEHHAYHQKENEEEETIPFGLGGRKFYVSAWQLSQALDFATLSKMYGNVFHLNVHGDGLIAHIVKTGFLAGKPTVEEDQAAA